ncbi:MAG: MBL fold metallo-hydrolase [Verrucomicrobia bacterium]|nr:MBL fold metallo-hydrolase [Verrucomicrobiota bacterium]
MDPAETNFTGHRASKRRLPRSFKELTPTRAFSPRTYFREMVWKPLMTRRRGRHKQPLFPHPRAGQVGLTWIGHSSFLVQLAACNLLIDPIFSNWLFVVKRQKHPGLRLKDIPNPDIVLITHAHFDHFHKPTLRRLPSNRIAIVPWGVGELAQGLGFDRILELEWWESYTRGDLRITFTPAKHWGARMISDHHRGYGGFVIEFQGRKIYHAGDSAYFDGFRQIGDKLAPEIALLPIGASHPESFRKVHMGPEDAVRAFKELRSHWLVPMHYGTFRLAFEDIDEPPRRLADLAAHAGLSKQLLILEEGVPVLL